MIGAHPDDEDTALLAYLARHENARTFYLSLTRGDGGQNIIGNELFEALGVIRTEELLQARRLDGAEQLFTRAFDFGFSKTIEEAKAKWNEDEILCDVVGAIREYQPTVVISRFSGTPADGHGQHQYAGYISPLAVKASADENRCTGNGAPWRVLKFYVSQGFRPDSPATLRINTGEYDFALGRSYFEIAMESRSQHKSQEQGILELRGDQFSGLRLIESDEVKSANEKSVFDGIDTSLSGISVSGALSVQMKSLLRSSEKDLTEARMNFNAHDPTKIIPSLVNAFFSIREIRSRLIESDIGNSSILALKERETLNAIQKCAGIVVDALGSNETIVGGESLNASVRVFISKRVSAKVVSASLGLPVGWKSESSQEPETPAMGFRPRNEIASYSAFFKLTAPVNASPTQPFFLESPRQGFLYGKNNLVNSPFQAPLITAKAIIEIEGKQFIFEKNLEYRFADDVRGEIRREINVVPKISLELDQKLLIVSSNERSPSREISLTLVNHSQTKQGGIARLNLPQGWICTPQSANFVLAAGEKSSRQFLVRIPRGVEKRVFEFSAEAKIGNETFSKSLHTIAYPHIQTHRFYTDAKTRVNIFDLNVAQVRVGYIAGSGDATPEALQQLKLNFTALDEKTLATGNLAVFDVIVVGIRASETRPDFVANNQRLLDFVKAGGTLIVQYQRPVYAQQKLVPFQTRIGPRVVDENAPVRILEPRHPLFNFPNKITVADFDGWVQERNLYNFAEFDKAYKPLLESHDAGEIENSGGLVVAKIGRGNYIYTSYSFFRQLPGGVAGAYRLFANLVSLPKAKN